MKRRFPGECAKPAAPPRAASGPPAHVAPRVGRRHPGRIPEEWSGQGWETNYGCRKIISSTKMYRDRPLWPRTSRVRCQGLTHAHGRSHSLGTARDLNVRRGSGERGRGAESARSSLLLCCATRGFYSHVPARWRFDRGVVTRGDTSLPESVRGDTGRTPPVIHARARYGKWTFGARARGLAGRAREDSAALACSRSPGCGGDIRGGEKASIAAVA